MRLLDSSSGWGGLPSSLGGQLLSGSLSSSGLASGLLSSCHDAGLELTDGLPSCRPVFIHFESSAREGATGAGSVYIHHYIGIVLECLIVLVGYSDGIESHK